MKNLAEEHKDMHRTSFGCKIMVLKTLKSIDLDKALLDADSKVSPAWQASSHAQSSGNLSSSLSQEKRLVRMYISLDR